MTFPRPIDPYSPDWAQWYRAHPGAHRAVGADAAAEGGGDEGEGAGEPPAAEPPAAEPPADWRAELPEDLQKVASRFTSSADAIRAIQAFQKREGQVRVPGRKPGAEASEEEQAAYLEQQNLYRKAVGIPDSPDDYEFPELPAEAMTDEAKASMAEWAKSFHELGVPKATAAALVERVRAENEQAAAAQLEADKAFGKAQEDALRAEWGGDYDKNKTLGVQALKNVAERAGLNVEELLKIETKDGRFLLDRSEIVKLFSVVGREMAEGTIGPVLSESEADRIDEQIRDLRKQATEAQREGDSKRANQLYEREQALIARAAGNRPIVGARGRAA